MQRHEELLRNENSARWQKRLICLITEQVGWSSTAYDVYLIWAEEEKENGSGADGSEEQTKMRMTLVMVGNRMIIGH